MLRIIRCTLQNLFDKKRVFTSSFHPYWRVARYYVAYLDYNYDEW